MSLLEKKDHSQELATIYSTVKHEFLYNILNAPILPYPFPHVYIENVWPQGFYEKILNALPHIDHYTALNEVGERNNIKINPNRFVFEPNAENVGKLEGESKEVLGAIAQDILKDSFVIKTILQKFSSFFSDKVGNILLDRLFVKDLKGYKIGPHTDSPRRLLSMLFYLPKDDKYKHTGTSLYIPKERGFTCEGGPHYVFEPFDRVKTFEYKPNSALIFIKSDRSFHGVEMLEDQEIERDVLLVDFQKYLA